MTLSMDEEIHAIRIKEGDLYYHTRTPHNAYVLLAKHINTLSEIKTLLARRCFVAITRLHYGSN